MKPEGASPVVEIRAPLFSESFAGTPVASVDGEPIPMRELTRALGQAHEEHGMPGAGKAAASQDVGKLLERLVTMRVIAAEARTMGMDELPEIAKAIADNRVSVARRILRERATRDVSPDPAEVEALVRQNTREVKLASLVFKEVGDAQALHQAVSKGGSFDTLASEAVSAGKAKRDDLSEFVKPEKLIPPVRNVIAGLGKGQVASGVIALPQGFTVVQVVDERFPEDPEAVARAEEASRDVRAQAELGNYLDALTKKHATVDRALLARVSFDSAKSFAAREKDGRALARIKGAAPVKVSDLAEEMRKQFFHGVERRADKKELGRLKQPFFDKLLFNRLLDREAEVQKIAASTEYVDQAEDYARSLLFGKFIERVLVPDVDVKESEARARYEQKKATFSTPPMLKLEALAFADAKSARTALEKAQKGTEFRWLAENADGQIPAEKRNLDLGGRPVALDALSEGQARSLRGAHEGDFRVHVEGDQHYLVHVTSEIAATVRPYEDVRQQVVNEVFGEKLDAALRDYAAKLEKEHRVEVYAKRIGT